MLAITFFSGIAKSPTLPLCQYSFWSDPLNFFMSNINYYYYSSSSWDKFSMVLIINHFLIYFIFFLRLIIITVTVVIHDNILLQANLEFFSLGSSIILSTHNFIDFGLLQD